MGKNHFRVAMLLVAGTFLFAGADPGLGQELLPSGTRSRTGTARPRQNVPHQVIRPVSAEVPEFDETCRSAATDYAPGADAQTDAADSQNEKNPLELEQRVNALEGELLRLRQSQKSETFFASDGAAADAQAAATASVDAEVADLQKQFKAFKDGLAAKKYPTLEVHGVFQADTGWFGQDDASLASVSDIQDGSSFRRARLSANGSVTENMNYFFQMDFAFPGRPTFTDVWMELVKIPGIGAVRLGQWKQPFSLEVVSSFRYTTFAERSVLFQAFDPFRHIALGFYNNSANERMTWAGSVYRPGNDQFGGSIGDNGNYAGVGRMTALPYYCDTEDGANYLHLGAGYNYVAPQNRLARFRTVPEYFVGEVGGGAVGTAGQAANGVVNGTPFFVDTAAFGVNNYQLIGSELLWVCGPLSLQTEAQYLFAKRTNDKSAGFPGMYAQVGYFLTGEHRPYNKEAGAIDRIKPFYSLWAQGERGCGWGAWELAGRYSTINLNDEDIRGGRLTDLTLGLNWYLNAYSKLQFNYIHAFLNNPTVGPSNTDIVGLRAQVDF